MRGWVYVITNAAMPDILKIGFSTKDPASRAREFSNTGVPQPYVVKYEALVADPRAVEHAAHKKLHRMRVTDNREWFRCSLEDAVAAIRAVAGSSVLLENVLGETEREVRPPARKGAIIWTLKASTGVLEHLPSGRTFLPSDYYLDNGGVMKGFVIHDAALPWAALEAVSEVD